MFFLSLLLMSRLIEYSRLEETVGELTRQAVLDRRCYDRTHALLTLAMGEVVETVTGEDPLAELRVRLRQWSRESTVGRELSGAVTVASQAVQRRTDQRATRRSGPIDTLRERWEQLREDRRRRVHEGEADFIDSADEAALRSGGMPRGSRPGRVPTPGPSGLQPIAVAHNRHGEVPREHRLIPVEWPAPEEESGFRVVPVYDLTRSDEEE